MKLHDAITRLSEGRDAELFKTLYGDDEKVFCAQQSRYVNAVKRFGEIFPTHKDIQIFSAPGRSEIGGNHTDHQHGCCLGAAVSADTAAVVAFHDDGVIRLFSEGFGATEVDLTDLSVHEDEKGRFSALIRGIAARFAAFGADIRGFDAYVVSDVLSGSGLSSSAAFETLLGTVINTAYNSDRSTPVEIAKIGQYAENVYFGKNSGLLDQTVCSVGGLVFIDFCDTGNPIVRKIDYDFEKAGFCLCVTDTKGSHANLTEDYEAIPKEMNSAAAYFGKACLREVDEEEFYAVIPALRTACGDRAVLRAMHFFGENRRAFEEAQALEQGDIKRFMTLYRQSAASSESLLQNLYATKAPAEQGIPLALAFSRRVLGDSGAVRVHGGGFAGTIQALVPAQRLTAYIACMDALFGEGSCQVLRTRPVGGVRIL